MEMRIMHKFIYVYFRKQLHLCIKLKERRKRKWMFRVHVDVQHKLESWGKDAPAKWHVVEHELQHYRSNETIGQFLWFYAKMPCCAFLFVAIVTFIFWNK